MTSPDVILPESLKPGAALIQGAQEISLFEVPSSRGIPVHLFTSRRTGVGDSAETDQKHWSPRLVKKSLCVTVLTGRSCPEHATERESEAHTESVGRCATRDTNMEGKQQTVGW